uniref:Gpi1p n=1 Tax=Hirondellea gigas TaxID=1518452 RepID=A0A6A7FTJ0_9CRUS
MSSTRVRSAPVPPKRFKHARHVCRIFWPECGTNLPSGYLIGWHISNFVCCIAGIIPNCSLAKLESSVRILVKDADCSDFWQYCNGPPSVLGSWNANPEDEHGHLEVLSPDVRRQSIPNLSSSPNHTTDFWVSIRSTDSNDDRSSSHSRPYLSDINCSSTPYPTSAQFIFYTRPKPGSYLSYRPFTFDFALLSDEEIKGTTVPLSDMDYTMRQINSSAQLLQKIQALLNGSRVPRRSISESFARDKFPAKHFDSLKAAMLSVLRCVVQPLHWILLLSRIVAEILLFALDWQLPVVFGGSTIKHRTAFGQQLHKRLTEVCRWPFMWLKTRRKWRNDAYAAANFISFWSSFWQVLADVVCGIALTVCMRVFLVQFLVVFHQAGHFLHLDVMRANIVWLMGLPAGLKLNHNLNHCFGSMVLFGIDFWDAITSVVTVWEPAVLWLISFAGILGASMVLSLCSDILSVVTIHVDFVYTTFAKLYSIEIKALSSLWKLFRGKKKNILRQRIDSCQFDVDQLMVGTILFSLIFFLLPTIATYFLFFSYVRFLVTFTKAGLWFFLFFFNYFPFCAMIIYAFDRGRLPGGIRFDVLQSEISNADIRKINRQISSPMIPSPRSPHSRMSPVEQQPRLTRVKSASEAFSPVLLRRTPEMSSCTYLKLRNSEIALSTLFFSYRSELARVFQHYSPRRIAKSLAFGYPYPEPPALVKHQTSYRWNSDDASSPTDHKQRSLRLQSIVDFWLFMKVYLTP